MVILFLLTAIDDNKVCLFFKLILGQLILFFGTVMKKLVASSAMYFRVKINAYILTGLLIGFYGISTFVGYLMPNSFLYR